LPEHSGELGVAPGVLLDIGPLVAAESFEELIDDFAYERFVRCV
jgi:hypothetical protein